MNKETVLRGIELALLLCLAGIFALGTALERQQQGISNQLIRLHVVAASDGEEAQNVKLRVRDAVLAAAEEIMEPAEDKDTAKALLRAHLSELEDAANGALALQNSPDRATVTLERELFGTREYGTFSLPGGYYDALRVRIGAGEGKNWWCVVYPQICSAATVDDQRTAAVMGGLSQEQVLILEGDTPEYRLKFKLLELLEDLLGWFRTGSEGIPVSG